MIQNTVSSYADHVNMRLYPILMEFGGIFNRDLSNLRHFQRFHKAITVDTRNRIVTYGKTLHLLPVEAVITPRPEDGPIDGLELVLNGWKCTYEECEDSFLSAVESITVMENHCRKHGWKRHDPPMWEKCAMQTFFQGKYVKYFEVYVEESETTGLDLLLENVLKQADKRDEEYRFNLNHVKKTNIVTKSPWLSRTRWEKKFMGRDMEVLFKLTEKPEEREGQICRVWKSTSRVI
jgi:hypothetical protein